MASTTAELRGRIVRLQSELDEISAALATLERSEMRVSEPAGLEPERRKLVAAVDDLIRELGGDPVDETANGLELQDRLMAAGARPDENAGSRMVAQLRAE